ncbi:MAG: hypothetical protein AAB456_01705 [Patescibacteria group bacterium]
MKSFVKENFPILIIILILFSYLGIKALDENGWDGWGFGSAQTLMSSEYWAKDGFAKNYFLFIPSSYSKLIKYLDEPEFRNRPIDDFDGALKRNRIYYTHYPPLYLVPYALMAKIGIRNRAAFRIFPLLISLSALFLFYLFIKSISTRAIAIIAFIYYGFSVTFLNYADSISTQPLTIFFTFLILVLSVLASRNFENPKIYLRYNLAIWGAYFALSLSSYDATFFVFAWLVLYDAILLKKLLWRKWMFFASAPVLGFALQLLQNAWYLGWAGAMRDTYVSYAGRAIGSFKNFVLGLTMPFVSMTSVKTVFIFKKTAVALISGTVILGTLWKFRQRIGIDFKYFKIIFILAVAAAIQPFFINITGWWPYQGVLTAPFWGLLIGASSVFIINALKNKELNIHKTFSFWILMAAVLIFWLAQFYGTFVYAKDWPNNRPDQKIIEFSKTIKTLYPNKEKMAFRILPKSPNWKSQFPTFNFEYYLGMPKVDFANTQDLLADFWWFRNISEYPFYSFIIAENKSDIEKIRQKLIAKNLKNISSITEIQGQYLFTVSPK